MLNLQLDSLVVLLLDIETALDVKDLTDIVPRIGEIRTMQGRLDSAQQNEIILEHANEGLKKQLAEQEAPVEAAWAGEKAAMDRATWSAWGLAEVKHALEFPVVVVNRSLLFDHKLEKEVKLNRTEIIQFLIP